MPWDQFIKLIVSLAITTPIRSKLYWQLFFCIISSKEPNLFGIPSLKSWTLGIYHGSGQPKILISSWTLSLKWKRNNTVKRSSKSGQNLSLCSRHTLKSCLVLQKICSMKCITTSVHAALDGPSQTLWWSLSLTVRIIFLLTPITMCTPKTCTFQNNL